MLLYNKYDFNPDFGNDDSIKAAWRFLGACSDSGVAPKPEKAAAVNSLNFISEIKIGAWRGSLLPYVYYPDFEVVIMNFDFVLSVMYKPDFDKYSALLQKDKSKLTNKELAIIRRIEDKGFLTDEGAALGKT